MTPGRSGDRHSRPDPEGRLGTLKQGHKQVVVIGEAEYSGTLAGQHLLQMLINLLARQYDVIDELVIGVPPLPVHEGVFRLHPVGGNLQEELIGLGEQVAGGEIRIARMESTDSRDLAPGSTGAVILVGSFRPDQKVHYEVAVVADGWRFQCTTKARTPSTLGKSGYPNGPYMAACYAAASVFKFLHSVDATVDLTYSLWNWDRGDWASLEAGIEPATIALDTLYAIGLGAVGAASIFTLAATRGLQGQVILIDPQKMDTTNRNRLVSGAYEDAEKFKVELAADTLAGCGLEAYLYSGRWPNYTADPSRTVPAAIRAREREDRYDWVLSSVDRNLQRRAIANSLPRHVIGGSSQGMTAQACYYSNFGVCECLACSHPAELVPSIEELTEQLKTMNPDERNRWYDARDVDPQKRIAIEEYLGDPACAHVGGAELHALGLEGATDWAVGFVSVTAGVLQATFLLQCRLLGVETALAVGNQWFAWFFRPDLGTSVARRKSSCDLCGSAIVHERLHRLWQ